MLGKRTKKIASRSFKNMKVTRHGDLVADRDDGLRHGLSDGLCWQRTRTDEDGEGWRGYGFVGFDPDDAALATDAEIDEWFDLNMWTEAHGDHDCTGRPFTRYIHWHRNPDGSISFVHAMAIDY